MTTRKLSFTNEASFNHDLVKSQRILSSMYQHEEKQRSSFAEMTVYDTTEFKVAS